MLVAALVAVAGLAGCADSGDGDLSDSQAQAAYANAVSIFDEGPSEADRVSITVTVTGEDESGTMRTLFSTDENLLAMTMEGSFTESSTGGSSDVEQMLVGQVHKTTFFGVPDTGLLGFYNESQEPPQGFSSADTGTQSSADQGEGPSPLTDPGSLFDTVGQAPDNATYTSSEITYDDQPAIELQATWTENGTSYDVTVVVLTETEQLVHVEGEATGGPEGTQTFEMNVAYGDDATHPQEEALFRAETMTFTKGEPDPFQGQQDGDTGAYTNHTIQPSQNPGTIALEALEVLAVPDDSGSDGPTPPALTLPAEEGTAENENVRLTYEDVDGDGAVSTDDRLVLEDLNTSDDETFSVQLRDEETGTRLAPGPGLVAGVLVLGAAALVRRR